jgi:glutamate-ammonia-ligase adenylyltransferase
MRVSDRLTDVAELIVGQAMEQGWRADDRAVRPPDVRRRTGAARGAHLRVGYGKLGGIELGYASDLDLVFLHDSTGEAQETDGERPLDNQVFFVRLAQRIVHLLTMHSAAGRLYEVDVRLRPSGKGGMLSRASGVRRLPAQGGLDLGTPGAAARARRRRGADAARRVRAHPARDLHPAVRRDTCATRCGDARAHATRAVAAKPAQFDLKQDPGGIADIEFLAQYWALRWADRHPPVAMFSDTIRQLESVASARPRAAGDGRRADAA